MKNKKYTTMRTFKSILLAGTMLLATPAFFGSCQENAPELDYEMKVTVVNDFTKVVEAINQSNISNEQAIKKITAAIDNMKGDQTDKLQAIVAALTSVNNTLETQLNVLAAAMQSMNLELPAKVELISTAVKNRPNYNDKLEAVKTAFQNINPNSQLETLNALLDKYGQNFTDKLSSISGWFMEIGYGNGRLDMIKRAIESLGGYGGKNEVQELYDNCTVTESTLNGWPGVMFVSKNNNNYIFFVYYSKSSSFGYRLTSALVPSDPSRSKCMCFENEGDRIVLKQENKIREDFRALIRPVYVKRSAK